MLEYRYDVPFKFTGTIDKLTFNLGPEQVTAAEREQMQKTVAGRATSGACATWDADRARPAWPR